MTSTTGKWEAVDFENAAEILSVPGSWKTGELGFGPRNHNKDTAADDGSYCYLGALCKARYERTGEFVFSTLEALPKGLWEVPSDSYNWNDTLVPDNEWAEGDDVVHERYRSNVVERLIQDAKFLRDRGE